MTDSGQLATFRVVDDPVCLTLEQKRLFARHALVQAASSAGIAKQMAINGLNNRMQLEEAMRWLETARDVWPLERDRDSISVEDILRGARP